MNRLNKKTIRVILSEEVKQYCRDKS